MRTLTRIIATFALACLFGISLAAQNTTCQASFTYTVGANGQVNFTNTSTGMTGNTTTLWQWQGFSTWGYSYSTSPTVNFTYNGTYWVSLSISDSAAGCQSWFTDTIIITNGQACQVSFTYTVGSNGQVSFTNTSVGNANFYWDFGDGNSSTLASPSHTYLYNGSYSVNLYADTVGGYCGGYANTTIVISNATPCNASASYIVNDNGNGVFVFTDTVTTNSSTTTSMWSVNGSYVGSGNPFTYVFNSNGTFQVCEWVQDSMGGCGDSACTYVTVTGMPCNDSAFFYLYQDSAQQGSWWAWLYSSNYSGMTGAVWSWGDGTSSTGLYPSHTYSTPGWYSICVTVYFACGDTSYFCENDSLYRTSAQMITVNVTNGTNAVHAPQKAMTSLKAYPNPFNDELTIGLASYENKDVTCALYDMMGNLITRENMRVVKGDNEIKMKTGDLTKGVYFIRVSDSNGTSATIKVVK